MNRLNDTEQELLRQCARSVVQMRNEIESKRFGLILGAGVSKPLGFPAWSALVSRIAEDSEVDGKHLLANVGNRIADTAKTQMLFQHFKSNYIEQASQPFSRKMERRIQGNWRRIIHRALYKEVPESPEELREKHPYLNNFIPIIRKSAMTVNYNFDDTVEQLLRADNKNAEVYGRGFETIWNANLQSLPDTAVIYHPNGFLPRNLVEHPSDTLVFSEDTFADQLIQSMAGHHASLLHHLSKTTCLFIGLSLQDPTLRHLLRQNAVINPGHYHYFVQFVEPGDNRDVTSEQSFRDANFEVYNLITLFLSSGEISALGRLLSLSDEDLRREAGDIAVELKYVYYLTGAVGAGKTTCLSYMRSLRTYEEWTEPALPELAKSWTDLSPQERIKVDEWIGQQFKLKNFRLLNENYGIHVVDRSPVDPLAFTTPANIADKAKFIISALNPGGGDRKVQKGHIIFLKGEPSEMESRVASRHKESDARVISDMQKKLIQIYKSDKGYVTVIDTTGASVYDVVKQVARAVMLDRYEPLELATLLKRSTARKPTQKKSGQKP